METLNKLAGVQDTAGLSASEVDQHSLPTIVADPPPIVSTDADPQHDNHTLSQRASRASLPTDRQPSNKSFHSAKSPYASRNPSKVDLSEYPPSPRVERHADRAQVPSPPQARRPRTSQDSAGTASTEDFAWGSNHPCFPHPNPHCAPLSHEAKTTRVIRVRRDWLASGDLYPQYANLYPEILDPMVTDTEFRFVVSNINGRLKSAFDPFTTRAWLDSLMGVATGFVWDDLGFAGPKRAVRDLERFVDEWNAQKKAAGMQVRMVHLRRTGFMALDFVVPDPGIDFAGDGEESAGGIGAAE